MNRIDSITKFRPLLVSTCLKMSQHLNIPFHFISFHDQEVYRSELPLPAGENLTHIYNPWESGEPGNQRFWMVLGTWILTNWTINSLGHTFIQRLDIAQTFQSHKAQKAQKRMFVVCVVFVVVVVSCRQG